MPKEKVNFGCSWGGEEIVIVQLSEQLQGSATLAAEIKKTIQQFNRRRQHNGTHKIAYKITTSECIEQQFQDVVKGKFRFVADADVIQEKEGPTFFLDRV